MQKEKIGKGEKKERRIGEERIGEKKNRGKGGKRKGE